MSPGWIALGVLAFVVIIGAFGIVGTGRIKRMLSTRNNKDSS